MQTLSFKVGHLSGLFNDSNMVNLVFNENIQYRKRAKKRVIQVIHKTTYAPESS